MSKENNNPLNPSQQAVVATTEGPILVLAGAGTGKTHALTSRVSQLIESKLAKPSEIIAVTFTNKAAKEMQERISYRAESSGIFMGSPWIGTFHGISNKILRSSLEMAGLSSRFHILDGNDQLRLIKEICDAVGLVGKSSNAAAVLNQIEAWKNQGLWVNDIKDQPVDNLDRNARIVYELYQQRLQELNTVDFGDLIIKTTKMIETNKEAAAYWQQKFRYFLVDEFQDINPAQYAWLKAIMGNSKNICCVGDDDQSIYSWRGADVSVMLNFQADWENVKIIRMETNYRSTGNILDVANNVIKSNKNRYPKSLKSSLGAGDKLKVVCYQDSRDEAHNIANIAKRMHDAKDIGYRNMAILVRTTAQMRELEDAMITARIPYQIIGGTKFYDREEIRDTSAYLRILNNEGDDIAFDRIINKPTRKIGAKIQDIISDYARSKGINKLKALKEISTDESLTLARRAPLKDFVQMYESWTLSFGELSPPKLIELILSESGYYGWLETSNKLNRESKLDNLRELINQSSQMESIDNLLDHMALYSDTDSMTNHGDRFNILTMHSAKGLEFDIVFLPGWEEEILPHARSINEVHGIEEERRLAYVGITRAKYQAIISFVRRRNRFGKFNNAYPSRFIEDIPNELLEFSNFDSYSSYGGAGHQNNYRGNYHHPSQRYSNSLIADDDGYSHKSQGGYKSGYQGGYTVGAPKNIQPRIPYANNSASGTYTETRQSSNYRSSSSKRSSYFDDENYNNLHIGDKCSHEHFGKGKVIELSDDFVTVDFAENGTRSVLPSFITKIG